MRISDWSSYVCSSDLVLSGEAPEPGVLDNFHPSPTGQSRRMRRPIAPPTVDPTMLKIEALAYIVVESADPARWQTFAEQMLGMQAVAQGSGLDRKSTRLNSSH